LELAAKSTNAKRSRWRLRSLPRINGSPLAPLSTITYRKDGIKLTFFWTTTTFCMPQDVTLEERRIESSFPADEPTDRLCRDLAGAVSHGAASVPGALVAAAT
jgi:hypothetical protein